MNRLFIIIIFLFSSIQLFAEPSGYFVVANGIKFHIEESGKGEPLLLIHGGTESIDEVRRLMVPLSKSFRVIAIDLRAHGYSSGDFRTITYENEYKDLLAIIQELDLDAIHFVGHSDGAILGILFAERHPKQVISLAAISGNIHPDGVKTEVIEFLNNADPETLPEKMRKNYLKHAQDLKDFPAYWNHMANLWKTSPRMATFDDLKNIEASTLFIVADHDTIRLDHTIKMFESTPDANLLVIPDATHALESMDLDILIPAILNNAKKN